MMHNDIEEENARENRHVKKTSTKLGEEREGILAQPGQAQCRRKKGEKIKARERKWG
jgi:hypothetical protein